MDSQEYQIRIAKPRLRRMISALQLLAVSSAPALKDEARLWLDVASQLMDKEFWQAVDDLVRRKIVDGKINGIDSLYFENHVLWAKQVLDRFVMPYLEGTIK